MGGSRGREVMLVRVTAGSGALSSCLLCHSRRDTEERHEKFQGNFTRCRVVEYCVTSPYRVLHVLP